MLLLHHRYTITPPLSLRNCSLKYKSIHGVILTWLHDDPLPETKNRFVTDGRTDVQMDGQTDKIAQVIAVTRFAARVSD